MTRDVGQNMLPAVKTENLSVSDFSDFYLAVSASVNDANQRKPNSFITPMTRDMDQNAASSKNRFFFVKVILEIS